MKSQNRCRSAYVTREQIKQESLVKYLASRPKSGRENGLYFYHNLSSICIKEQILKALLLLINLSFHVFIYLKMHSFKNMNSNNNIPVKLLWMQILLKTFYFLLSHWSHLSYYLFFYFFWHVSVSVKFNLFFYLN